MKQLTNRQKRVMDRIVKILVDEGFYVPLKDEYSVDPEITSFYTMGSRHKTFIHDCYDITLHFKAPVEEKE